jgi:hypothetical protein
MTTANVYVLKGEVLHGGPQPANLAALKGEVLYGATPSAKVTAVKMEVLYSIAVYTPPVSRRRVCVVVTR